MGAPELVAIADGALTARINPLGAELWSLTDAHGREYMTDADPAYWTGHAPLLFPIVGALNGGVYRLGGREYALPKHGFARTSRFEVEPVAADRVRFRLRDSEETRAVYPFAFEFTVEFALQDLMLSVVVTVRNSGSEPMPFSFGFHPAFAWPLPGGGAKDAHRVIFAQDEPEPIHRLDAAATTLLAQSEPTPVVGNVLAPEASLFDKDALIWLGLNSRALTFAGAGAALHLEFPDSPDLGVWQKPGAPFLALEPWRGFNDPQGFAGDLHEKPGIVELPAGGEQRFRLTIAVEPAKDTD